jgi:hypothetical protein
MTTVSTLTWEQSLLTLAGEARRTAQMADKTALAASRVTDGGLM